MKKIYLLSTLLLWSLLNYAQTLTGPTGTVTSNTSITIKGSMESSSAYIAATGLQYVPGDNYTTNPGSGLQSYISANSMSAVSPFNGFTIPVTNTQFNITVLNNNAAGVGITVYLAFKFYLVINGGTSSTLTEVFVPVTIQPVASQAESGSYTRNNCGTYFTGSSVGYTVAAGAFSGGTQSIANTNALNYLNTQGQANANANGTCTQTTFGNNLQQQGFSKNDCASGLTGGFVLYSVAANTYTASSQTAADNLALADIAANGQTNANNLGNCTVQGPYTINMVSTGPSSTYFTMSVNGVNISGVSRGIAGNNGTNSVTNTNVILQTNSTFTVQVTSGYMPVSAFMIGNFGFISGVISGDTITFSNVDNTNGTTCAMQIN